MRSRYGFLSKYYKYDLLGPRLKNTYPNHSTTELDRVTADLDREQRRRLKLFIGNTLYDLCKIGFSKPFRSVHSSTIGYEDHRQAACESEHPGQVLAAHLYVICSLLTTSIA
jgi:hypothetical protein